MNAVCNGVTGALSEVGKFAKDAGNEIVGGFKKAWNWLSGRKKRSSCVPPVIPTLDINVDGIQGKIPNCKKFPNSAPCQLLEFAKKLRPDMNFDAFDLDLDALKTLFESQSIADIRQRLMNVVKYIFKHVQAIFAKCKKFFYFATLIFLIYDGYK